MTGKYLQTGMSLIETMMVLVLLGILTGAAMPSMKQLLLAQQVRAGIHELSTDFALARMTAISRSRSVVVCPASGNRCADDGDWSRGWMVFVDGDGNHVADNAAEVIVTRAARDDGLLIGSSLGRPRLRYLPTGASYGSNLTVNICAQARLQAQVVVNNAGRTRVDRRGNGNACPM